MLTSDNSHSSADNQSRDVHSICLLARFIIIAMTSARAKGGGLRNGMVYFRGKLQIHTPKPGSLAVSYH